LRKTRDKRAVQGYRQVLEEKMKYVGRSLVRKSSRKEGMNDPSYLFKDVGENEQGIIHSA